MLEIKPKDEPTSTPPLPVKDSHDSKKETTPKKVTPKKYVKTTVHKKLEKIDLTKVGLQLIETKKTSNKVDKIKAPVRKSVRKTPSWQKKNESAPKETKLIMIETKKTKTKTKTEATKKVSQSKN